MPLGANYRKLFAATTISNLGDGVGVIAYPWLASAITRSPLLIALVAVAQRLPWLFFTLPVGVLTDRHDRRTLMVGANAVRAVLTFAVAAAVLARQGAIPAPDEVEQVVDTEWLLYVAVIVATLLLGVCEVLYDNSAQTFLPSIVEKEHLERANGRMFSAELVANQFIGPPLAGVLLLVGFALPLFFDAATFAASAALIFAIVASPRPPRVGAEIVERRPWRSEAAEGFRWLWRHDVIRTLAISLGVLNLLGNMSTGLLVLFGQEVLDTSVTEFALLSTAGAVGGVVGGWTASSVSKRLGSGGTLRLTLWGGAVTSVLTGLASSWLIVAALTFITIYTAVMWNVITVSFRQAVIPDRLLGRVNSVYRFFGWGAIPIGGLLGGLIVAVLDGPFSRDVALRAPWILAGVGYVVLAVLVAGKLTTARLEAARAASEEGNVRAVTPAPR